MHSDIKWSFVEKNKVDGKLPGNIIFLFCFAGLQVKQYFCTSNSNDVFENYRAGAKEVTVADGK